jgi:hypothetical protein
MEGDLVVANPENNNKRLKKQTQNNWLLRHLEHYLSNNYMV